MMKTLVTVGPESLNLDDLTYFAEKTKLFRLNGSHSTIEWHKKAINMIRAISPESFILMDIPGIKPRTENLEIINIKRGVILKRYENRQKLYNFNSLMKFFHQTELFALQSRVNA